MGRLAFPGSPSDTQLFHADASDRIFVCPSHLGQGYFQEILLRDDLTLFIHDYMLNQDVVIDAPSEKEHLDQGSTRRTYLEHKTLKLVALRLDAMTQPHLKKSELDCIYQAASILRNQVANPPTVETLARLVNTNRFDLNQGFREVYGATPFDYSRNSRLWQARRLLITSDLSIVDVAAAVGYTSRSRFATAFRQKFGLNPKAFQMHAWQCASQISSAKNCG